MFPISVAPHPRTAGAVALRVGSASDVAGTPTSLPAWRMWAAAFVVAASFVISNAATPLYVRWQEQIGFSSTVLTALFSVYIVGLLATLAVAGPCADRFGTRAVLLPGTGAGLASCALFAGADSVPALLAARLMAGVSVGVALAAGTAAVMQLGGPERRRTASLLASSSVVTGAAIGPMLAGCTARASSDPIPFVFMSILALQLVAGAAVFTVPAHRRSDADARWRPHLPTADRPNRPDLVNGVSVLGCAMTSTAFVLSAGPLVLSRLSGAVDPLVAGGMASAMFVAGTLVQLPAARFPVRAMFAASTVLLVGACVAILTAVVGGTVWPLLAGAILAGCGQGLAQLGGLTLIGLHVAPDRRAESNALLNIGGYVPCGLTPLLTGVALDRTGITVGAAGFAVALCLATVLAGYFVLRRLGPGSSRPTTPVGRAAQT